MTGVEGLRTEVRVVWAPVAVHVEIAGVAETVPIHVGLVGVRDIGTVVVEGAHVVPVVVLATQFLLGNVYNHLNIVVVGFAFVVRDGESHLVGARVVVGVFSGDAARIHVVVRDPVAVGVDRGVEIPGVGDDGWFLAQVVLVEGAGPVEGNGVVGACEDRNAGFSHRGQFAGGEDDGHEGSGTAAPVVGFLEIPEKDQHGAVCDHVDQFLGPIEGRLPVVRADTGPVVGAEVHRMVPVAGNGLEMDNGIGVIGQDLQADTVGIDERLLLTWTGGHRGGEVERESPARVVVEASIDENGFGGLDLDVVVVDGVVRRIDLDSFPRGARQCGVCPEFVGIEMEARRVVAVGQVRDVDLRGGVVTRDTRHECHTTWTSAWTKYGKS